MTTTPEQLDPFTLGGRQDDAEIIELFEQWRAAWKATDDPDDHDFSDDEMDAFANQISELEYRLAEKPAKGIVGLVIHAYMAAVRHLDGPLGPPAGSLRPVTADSYAKHGMMLGDRAIKALVIDLVNFVPEIEPLTANWLAAPIAPDTVAAGAQQDDDAALVAAQGGCGAWPIWSTSPRCAG